MKLFRRRSREWLVQEAEDIEEIIASPIVGLSHPTSGGQQFRSLAEAVLVLEQVEARIDEIDGVKRKNPIRKRVLFGVRPR
ncbi:MULTISPECIES: hypothetical protein [Rhizobium/Agrobacterium group]|uniref:hypothetical protein n=1 Tax=Rhizobium/Agrobacterium group TaxID=227290 RepID=UPI0009BA055A|nr:MULTISPECIES: hypothetical protein [Rhizobium/Agrobacterium group]CAD7036316.1 hypothetical protein RP007_04440 [Rhizobium sp. P007]